MSHELAAAVALCLAVVARCGGFVAASTFPVYPGVGGRVRLAMAIAVSAMAMPAVLGSGAAADAITPLGIAAEGLLGLAMGTAVACVTASAAWALGMAATSCGLDGGDDADPLSVEGAGIARLAWWLSAGGFVAAGGVRGVLGGLLDSFRTIPIGGHGPIGAHGDGAASQLLAVAIEIPAAAFVIAVSLAVPILAAILAYHAAVAVATRAAGFEPGLGIVQASAAILLVVILFLTADVWIAGFPRRIDAAIGGAFTAKEVR